MKLKEWQEAQNSKSNIFNKAEIFYLFLRSMKAMLEIQTINNINQGDKYEKNKNNR